jgi:hypothetical protein
VDHVERTVEQKGTAVAYIYCNYKEQGDQTSANLIASLLQQLTQKNPVLSNNTMALYHRHREKQTRPTLSEWSQLLQSEVRGLFKVFIIVDALDECSESNGSRDSFLAEIRKLQPDIHLLVTSRHLTSIEHEFEKAARVEIRASDEDIRRYLESRTERERRLLRHVNTDQDLKEAIVSTIVENAKGM